jgi:hypothetical protein
MENPRLRVPIAAGLLLLAGCSSAAQLKQTLEATLERRIGQLVHASRGPGNKLLKLSAETAQDESCAGRRLPFFRLIGSEARPSRVKSGERFNHRFTYAFCPRQGGETTTVRLTKRIAHAGRTILADTEARYLLRPGTWADDDDIEVPPEAAPGRYTVRIEVVYRKAVSRTQAEFQVEER